MLIYVPFFFFFCVCAFCEESTREEWVFKREEGAAGFCLLRFNKTLRMQLFLSPKHTGFHIQGEVKDLENQF